MTFVEKGVGGDTLRTRHDKFADTGASQTFKGNQEFIVTNDRTGEILKLEVLRTNLRLTTCLETALVYWYVGVSVTFTTLIVKTETALLERQGKTTFYFPGKFLNFSEATTGGVL